MPESAHLEVEGLTAEEIGTIALEEHVALFELKESHSTLEQAYMHLTRGGSRVLVPRIWTGRERPMTTTFAMSAPKVGRQGVLDVCRAEWLRVRSSRASKLFLFFVVVVPLFWCYEQASSTEPISSTMGGLYASTPDRRLGDKVPVLHRRVFDRVHPHHHDDGTSTATALRLEVPRGGSGHDPLHGAGRHLLLPLGESLLRSSHPPLRLGLSSPSVMHVFVAVGIYAALLAVLCVSLGGTHPVHRGSSACRRHPTRA